MDESVFGLNSRMCIAYFDCSTSGTAVQVHISAVFFIIRENEKRRSGNSTHLSLRHSFSLSIFKAPL